MEEREVIFLVICFCHSIFTFTKTTVIEDKFLELIAKKIFQVSNINNDVSITFNDFLFCIETNYDLSHFLAAFGKLLNRTRKY